MPLTDEEQILANIALEHIKAHADEVIQEFSGSCIPVPKPVSLFMAGSPGAGKTEISKSLMRRFETVPVRIDADAIRAWCPGYTGPNAHVFQRAANKGVNILYDHALNKGLHAILDGTFAYKDWSNNIERSIKRGRIVELWFIYQDPVKAWEFTKVREAVESRRVSKDLFIRSYLLAKQNAKEAKLLYRESLTLNLLVKNLDNGDQTTRLNIQHNDLDPYIGSAYTEEQLKELLI